MRILIAGDSLGLPRPHRINNYSPKENELAVAYHETYSSILNRQLSQEFNGEPFVEVINRSKRFQTIKNVCAEFTDHLFFYEPDVFVLQVGIVDCWFRDNLNGKQMVNKNDYKNYLNQILKWLSFRPNCRLIMIGICPTSEKMEKRYPGINKEIEEYNIILNETANNKTIFYLDMERYIESENPHKYLLPDDHHLNKEGNKIVAHSLFIQIQSFMYSDKGAQFYNEKQYEKAIEYFKRSFELYKDYRDNLYNSLVLAFELKDQAYFNKVLDYIQVNNLPYEELKELLLVLKIEERI